MAVHRVALVLYVDGADTHLVGVPEAPPAVTVSAVLVVSGVGAGSKPFGRVRGS